ncbi:MAG: hypothetical protein JW955_02415 [Sedimentisphaerales bacterium]|nr:hypothetical protein [Sedimentisphaerales bacterium]
MTNTEYRKSRGTENPFSGSEDQTKAIWNEQIRREKYHHRKPNPTPETARKG